MRAPIAFFCLLFFCATVAQAANPVPLINQPLVPDAIAPGGAGFTMTVNGTGFVTSSVANWNGSARATTFVSGSQLTAMILASDIANASTASVTVLNPSPGGGASNVVFFSITLPSSSITLSRSDFAVNPGPAGVSAGDFNDDGKLDLAVADYASNTISILLGSGDGTFQPHVDYATGAAPDSPVVGDFNRDGSLDVAVRSQNSNAVSVLLGNGDGTFANSSDYAAGSGNGSLSVGDLNGDGRLDLASTSGNSVYILVGKGDGTFQSAVPYPTGSGAYGITLGDLNEDGKLDLAIGDLNGDAVSILLGNGDGTFQPYVDYAAGTGPIWINLADLNGDGTLDLVVPNAFSNTVSILLGNGNGTFQPQVEYSVGSVALGRSSVADLNGDGKVDLAVTGSPSIVFLLLGNGDGTFQLPISYTTGAEPIAPAVGDFNGDGRLDLGVSNIADDTVSILLQAPVVTLSNASLKFNVQLVGTSSIAQSVILTNSGVATLTISSIVVSGDFLEKDNCGSSVPPGASCTIKVSFKPTSKGRLNGTITVTDNAADSPQTIALAGTGTVVRFSTGSLDFGNQPVGTTSQPQTVRVTNIGTAPLFLTGIGITGTNFGDFVETTTCGSRLAPGASCAINVRFRPKAKGGRQAFLDVADNGGGSPQRVALAGTGT